MNGSRDGYGPHRMRSCANDIRPSTDKIAQPIPLTGFHQEQTCPDYRSSAPPATGFVKGGGGTAWIEDDSFEGWVGADVEESGVPYGWELSD